MPRSPTSLQTLAEVPMAKEQAEHLEDFADEMAAFDQEQSHVQEVAAAKTGTLTPHELAVLRQISLPASHQEDRKEVALDMAEKLGAATALLLDALGNPHKQDFLDFCQDQQALPFEVLLCGLRARIEQRDFGYFPDAFWVQVAKENTERVLCKNCGNEIIRARVGQLYCCNHCAGYAGGKGLVRWGEHSSFCVIKEKEWIAPLQKKSA